MEYHELAPQIVLSDYIKCYWYFHKTTSTPLTYNIMPDGCFDLLIFIKDNTISHCMLTGLWSKMVTVEYTYTDIIGIRFKPYAISTLLNIRMRDALDSSFDFNMKDWGIDGDFFLETQINFVKIAEYFDRCFSLMIKTNNEDKRMQHLFKIIEGMFGTVNVDTISQKIGLSSRQIHRKLSENIGLGLKEYANIIRFDYSLKMLEKEGTYSHGYYDQSHFIKDFKRYTGLCPKDVDLNNDERYAFFSNI